MIQSLRAYAATARMNIRSNLYFGLLYTLGSYALRIFGVAAMLLLWRAVFMQGADLQGFTLAQMMTYTLLSSILADPLNVRTNASNWLREETILCQYVRPMPLLGGMIAETLGAWVLPFCLISIPMMLAAPLFHIALSPVTLWFLPSLLLTISLGFAIDFLFACLYIRMPNAEWLASLIRAAIMTLLSGSLIPLSALPWGLGDVLIWQPFASLGGAPLSIFVGLADPKMMIPMQIAWNALLWPLAVWAWARSQERMVSFGG